MALQAAEVWTGSEGVLERAVSVPERRRRRLTLSESEHPVVARAGVTGPAWLGVWLPRLLDGRGGAAVAPATHSGELLGLIVVERAADDDTFSGEDEERCWPNWPARSAWRSTTCSSTRRCRRSLEEVRRQAEELRESRSRRGVPVAPTPNGGKIERDLHDGAQQHLVALAVSLRLARQVADKDPEQAKAMLDELGGALQEAVQELRNLAHGIYPPVLMDERPDRRAGGGGGSGGSPADVVAADDIGRFSQQIEAAVYFCCLEALQNAGKHAGADASVAIQLREADDLLQFSVTDDGPGFDVGSATAGHGFVNMSDRLARVAGAVEWTSAWRRGADLGHDPPPVSVPEPLPDEDRAGSPATPVVVTARSEIRTRWVGLLLIGLLAGAVGAVTISGIALARRTTTAYDRLGDATKVDDARGYVLRYPESWSTPTALPIVTDRWIGGIGIAKVDGDNTFIGITVGPRLGPRPSSIRSCSTVAFPACLGRP